MKKFTVLIVVLVCLSLSLGCSRRRSNASASAPEVLVTEVARKDVPIIKEWVATLDGLVNASISARVAGHLISQDYPNRKRIVLVGHSMGGMISRLMVTDAKDTIWRDFFGTAPAKTPLLGETRQLVEKALVFDHRPEIKRVVFISTPHRGTPLVSGWIGRIASALVRTPPFLASVYASAKPIEIADPAAGPLNRVANGVATLEPNDRFVEAVNKLPLTPGIPYHSIIGDRGRGDTPNSSDGAVAVLEFSPRWRAIRVNRSFRPFIRRMESRSA